MKSFFPVFIGLLLAFTNCIGQDRIPALQKYFETLSANGQFNGSLLVAEKGKIVYRYSYGYADFENRIPNSSETPFVLASISKTITTTGVLQLVAKGKLDLNKPVRNYLHWFPYPKITTRHLLSHTSGLPPYNAYLDSLKKLRPDTVFSNADFAHGVLANPRPLLYEPGERGNYDNVNFLVLAILIEQVSKMKYGDYIKKYVLLPAGMYHTKLVPPRIQYNDAAPNNFARPYLFPHVYSEKKIRASRVPYVVSYWSVYNFSGFADYVSTASDLLVFDKAWYGGKLLPKQIREEAYIPVRLNNGKINPARFGLGWEVYADSSLGLVVYHNGNATGSNCTLVRNISRQQTIIVFDNIHADNAQKLSFIALDILNGRKVPLPKKSLSKIYAGVLLNAGATAARDTLLRLRADSMHYYLSEEEINLLGYDLMGGPNNPNPYHFPEENKYEEALAAFKLNVEFFPQSWNAYDSYGEILLKLGRRKEAYEMYKRSVELNPGNEGGKRVLAEMTKE